MWILVKFNGFYFPLVNQPTMWRILFMSFQSQNYLPTPLYTHTHTHTHTQRTVCTMWVKVIRDITHTYSECLHVVSGTEQWRKEHTHPCSRPPTHTGSCMITTIKTTTRLLMWVSRGSGTYNDEFVQLCLPKQEMDQCLILQTFNNTNIFIEDMRYGRIWM